MKIMKLHIKLDFVAYVLLSGLLVVMFTTGGRFSHAYDGDVDFSAPYLTVDPETGELITVDPKEEQAAAQNPTSQADHTAASPVTESIATGEPVGSEDNKASRSTMIVAGAAIALVAAVIVITATRRKNHLSDHQS